MKRQIEKQLRYFHKGMATIANASPIGPFVYAAILMGMFTVLGVNIKALLIHPTLLDFVVTFISGWIIGVAAYAIFISPCKHHFTKTNVYYGDQALHVGARSQWCCSKCGLVKFSRNIDNLET